MAEQNYYQRLFGEKISQREKQIKDMAPMFVEQNTNVNPAMFDPMLQSQKSGEVEAMDLLKSRDTAARIQKDTDIKTEIENEFKNGTFPNTIKPEDVLEKITSGKYKTVAEVAYNYNKKLARIAAEKEEKPKDVEDFRKKFNEKYDQAFGIVKDSIKQDIINDELPLDKDISDRLMKYPNEIKQAKEAYKAFKETGMFYSAPEKIGDKINAMKKTGIDTKDLEVKYAEELSVPKYLFKKFGEGLSSDIYQAPDAPTQLSEYAGMASAGAGMLVGGIALNKLVAFGATKVLSPALMGGAIKTAEVATAVSETAPILDKALTKTANVLFKGSKALNFDAILKSSQELNILSKEAYLTGKAAQVLGAQAEAETALATSVALKSTASKKALGVMLKSATIEGTVVGATKGGIAMMKGEADLSDAIQTTLTDAIAYPAGAALLYAGSKQIGKQMLKGFEPDVAEYAKGTGEVGASLMFPSVRTKIKTEAGLFKEYLANDTVKALANKGIDVDVFRNALSKGELDVDSKMALNALNKINILNEAMGLEEKDALKVSSAALLSKPELMKKNMIESAKEQAAKLFTGENAPLKDIYNSNPNIKNFIDAGMPIHALDTLNSGVAIKLGSGEIKAEDLLDGYMQVDKKIMADMMTKKVLDSSMPSLTKDQKLRLSKVPEEAKKIIEAQKIEDPEMWDSIEQSLKDKIYAEGKSYQGTKSKYLAGGQSKRDKMYDAVYRHFLEGTDESLKNLESVATEPKTHSVTLPAGSKVFGNTTKKSVTFSRTGKPTYKLFTTVQNDIAKVKGSLLNPKEVNDLIEVQVSKWFSSTGDLVPSKGLTGADALIDAMVNQNQKLLETTAEAFGRSALANPDSYQSIKTSEAKGIREAIKLKHYEEDLSFSIKGYQATNKEYQEALKSGADAIELASYKLRMKDLLNHQNSLKKNIADITTGLSSLNTEETPNAMQDIIAKAQGIFSPSLTLAREKGMSIQQAEEAMMGGKFLKSEVINDTLSKRLDSIISPKAGTDMKFWDTIDPESPYALKQDSDMAKEMLYMSVANTDFGATYNAKLGFGGWSKAALALKKEFGDESATAKFLVDGYKEREIQANKLRDTFIEKLQSFGIRKGSIESKVAHFFGEKFPMKEITDESGVVTKQWNENAIQDRFENLTKRLKDLTPLEKREFDYIKQYNSMNESQKQKIQSIIPFAREVYEGWHKAVNQVMEANGQHKLGYIENYFKHFTKKNEFAEDFQRYLDGERDGFKVMESRKINPDGSSKIYNPASFHRETLDTDYDLMSGIESYVETSSKVLTKTDFVRKIDALMNIAPQNMKEFLRHVKNERILGVSGVDKTMFGGENLAKKSIKFIDNWSTKAKLFAKASTALNQVSSMAFAFAENPGYGMPAALDLINPAKKESIDAIITKSKNIAIRSTHVGGLDNLDGIYGKMIREAFETKMLGGHSEQTKAKNFVIDATSTVSKLGMVATDYFDKLAAKHMFLSTYRKGIDLGLSDDAAVRMADYATDKFHNDLSKIGRAAYQDSVLGRALTRFTSFTNNLFHGLLTDLPRLEQKEGTAAMVDNMVKMAAKLEITNEMYNAVGLNSPFDMFSLIPGLGTSKFGPTGVLDLSKDVMQVAATAPNADMDEKSYEQAKKAVYKDLSELIFSTQGRRIKDVIEKSSEGGYDFEGGYADMLRDLIQSVKGNEKTKEEMMFKKQANQYYQKEFSPTYPRPFIKGKVKKMFER